MNALKLYDELKTRGIQLLVDQFQEKESGLSYNLYYKQQLNRQDKQEFQQNIDTQLFECILSAYSVASDLLRPKQTQIEQFNFLAEFSLMTKDLITLENIKNPFFFYCEDNFFNNPQLIDQQTLFNHILENSEYKQEFQRMDRHQIAMTIIVWKGYQLLQQKYPDKIIEVLIQPVLKNFIYLVDQQPYIFSEQYKHLYIRQSSYNSTKVDYNSFSNRLDKGISINNVTFFEQTNIELGQGIFQLQLKRQQELQQSLFQEIIISDFPYEQMEQEYLSKYKEGYINIKQKQFYHYYSDCYQEGHLINIKSLKCDQCNQVKDISTIFYDEKFEDYFATTQQKLLQHISKLYPALLIQPLTLKKVKHEDQWYVSLNFDQQQICMLLYNSITLNWNGNLEYVNEIVEKSGYEQNI